MGKIVYNHPTSGEQILTEVEEGGRLAPYITAVWNEKVDGPLTAAKEAKLGGLVRSAAGKISVNTILLNAHLVKKQAEADKKNEKGQAKRDLKTLILSPAATLAQTRAAVQIILKALG